MADAARNLDLTPATEETLGNLARHLLVAAGADPSDACTVAEILLWSDRRGHETQGLYLLPMLARRLRLKRILSPAKMVLRMQARSMATLDAAHGFGQVAARLATDYATGMARREGLGLCAVRDSHHFGAAGYYVSRAAEAGMIGVIASNSMAKVAPHGGARRLLGTNPLALACPRHDHPPLIIDLATGASAGSTVTASRLEGRLLPPNVALDATGEPTTDPAEVDDGGCLLPFGGAKGYAMGLLVEILAGVLTGAAIAPNVGSMFRDLDRFSRTGHLCLVLDPARFLPREEFLDRVEELVCAIKTVPVRNGFDEVLLPGERRHRLAEESSRSGISVSPAVRSRLEATARELRVPLPW